MSDSYNSGTVQGFIGIGGVVGQMYNGEVVRSYNLGDIRTTKTVASLDHNKLPTANMGGVVGDTTEDTPYPVSALIYDVYNKGKLAMKPLPMRPAMSAALSAGSEGLLRKPTTAVMFIMAIMSSAVLSAGITKAISKMYSIQGM